MPRLRRIPKERISLDLSELAWSLLTDEPLPAGHSKWEKYALECGIPGEPLLRDLWAELQADVLGFFIEQHPGKRPCVWWNFAATDHRKRIRGSGTPLHGISDFSRNLKLGVPNSWIQPGQQERVYGVDAVDPLSPPAYESQASFLKRHGLFLAGEEARLTHVDLEPEELGPEWWGEEEWR